MNENSSYIAKGADYIMSLCCVCGKEISEKEAYDNKMLYQFREYTVCMQCNQELRKCYYNTSANSDEGKEYLKEKMALGTVQPEAVRMVREHMHDLKEDELCQKDPDVPVGRVVDRSGTNTVRDSIIQERHTLTNGQDKSYDTITWLYIAGVIWFILAAVLYFVSVNNEFGVANIQATVYSACIAVMGTVCFVGAQIIKAIRR